MHSHQKSYFARVYGKRSWYANICLLQTGPLYISLSPLNQIKLLPISTRLIPKYQQYYTNNQTIAIQLREERLSSAICQKLSLLIPEQSFIKAEKKKASVHKIQDKRRVTILAKRKASMALKSALSNLSCKVSANVPRIVKVHHVASTININLITLDFFG